MRQEQPVAFLAHVPGATDIFANTFTFILQGFAVLICKSVRNALVCGRHFFLLEGMLER